ncbi:MAG: T9SS type A sorting domain-containing protein [Bacteroidia bacterium]
MTNNVVGANNNTLFVMPSAPTSTTIKAGINVVNCNITHPWSNFAQVNTIYSTGKFLSNNTTPGGANVSVRGIYITSSAEWYLLCNTIYNVGQCIRFDENCNTSEYPTNYLTTVAGSQCYDGIVYGTNGITGPEFGPGYPLGVVWQAPTNFLHSQTAMYSAPDPVSSNSILFLTGSPCSTTYPCPNLNYSNNIIDPTKYSYNEPGAIVPTTGDITSCSEADRPTHKAANDTMEIEQHQMDLIVQDSIPYHEFVPETQELNKQWVFNSLNTNNALMAGDSVLTDFYNKTQYTNIGTINTIEQLTEQGNYSKAQSLNNALVPQCTIEQNHKDVKNVLFNTLAKGIDTLNNAQIDVLWNIAEQCAFTGGKAVYEARYMLDYFYNTAIQFEDTCSGPINLEMPQKKSVKNFIITSVYPNPANTALNVEVDLPLGQTDNICLYDELGKKIICQELNSNLTTISINSLSSGIYLYRITDINGNLVKTDKVMIVH